MSKTVKSINFLTKEGATRPEQIRRRLQWLAHEWRIPMKDIPPVGNVPTAKLTNFVRKHAINWDWLLCGDLVGLQKMMREHKDRSDGQDKWINFLKTCVEAIPPHRRLTAIEGIRKMGQES